MLLDSLHSAHRHAYPPFIEEALDWLRAQDLDRLAPGRLAIDGDRLFATVLELETQPAPLLRPEAHRRYFDLHYLHAGTEIIGWAPADARHPEAGPYDPERDVIFYHSARGENFLTVRAGQIFGFAPGELHRSALLLTTPDPIKRVVIKILHDD